METIKNKIHRDKLNKNINICRDTCFFDIETTGFSRKKDIVYLIGILYFDKEEDSWVIAQYFANNLKDELKVIEEASQFLMSFHRIVNYNGNTFDIPFINSKLKSFGFSFTLDIKKSIDLYSIIRKNKDILQLKNLKLKSIEQYLGIYREDIYSGKDCINFYKDYILSKDKRLKERLLAHNFQDLYYLVDIMDILDIIKQKKSFEIVRKDEIIAFLLEDIEQSKASLVFKGRIKGLDGKFIYYGNNFNLIIEDPNKFKITIYTKKALVSPEEIALYIDQNEFDLSFNINSNDTYNIPNNIFLLKVKSNYILENILMLLKEIVYKTI